MTLRGHGEHKLRGHREQPAHWVDFLSVELEIFEPGSL